MSQNFLPCERDQTLLMPPSLREWLPEDHLAWFVLDAVEQLELEPFYAAYRADGWGRAAHDPQMMVALMLYAYAVGERSARGIERRLQEDVAFRVIAANQAPDHATIARFRVRHCEPLADLFGQILGLCAKAGLVSAKVVAIDSTKVHANASGLANRDYHQIAREILEEAGRIDAAEDELYGPRRGDELPPELCGQRSRREWIANARRELAEQQATRPPATSRTKRLAEAKRRLEEEHATECMVETHHEERKAELLAQGKRPRGRPPKPRTVPDSPPGRVNVTDPDSRPVKTNRGFIQGYNAQVATTEDQIVVAAEVTLGSADGGRLAPLVAAARKELERAEADEHPQMVVADAGYWSKTQVQELATQGIAPLVPPDGHARKGKPPPNRSGGIYDFMRRTLASGRGRELYRKRQVMVEPVFAQIKVGRRADRFQRRGLAACRAEWRLLTATHNLLKLHRFSSPVAA